MREPSSARSIVSRGEPDEAGHPILRVVGDGPGPYQRDLVPVRRDGSGRLVAVGLVRVPYGADEERWTTIRGTALPGETVEAMVTRCVAEALGQDARARQSDPPRVGEAGRRAPGRRDDPGSSADRAVAPGPTAVEVLGHLQPRGAVLRFAWFLVTALPARRDVGPEQWAILADLLESEGERGLATRMRQF